MKQTLKALLEETNADKKGVLEALHLAQEQDGYVSKASMRKIAQYFELPETRVFETASFYSYLHLEPVGRHVIRVCESAPCHIAGASEVVKALEKLLGVSMGSTTGDGRFTLQYAQCVGQCQGSPTITIDRETHTRMTPENLPAVLAAYK